MTGRHFRWLAVALPILSIGLTIGAAVLRALNSGGPGPSDLPAPDDIAMAALFPLAGLLIGLYRPDNRLGWICILIGLAGALAVFSPEYAAYSLFTRPGSLPGGGLMAWMGVWVWSLGWVGIALLMLLFPDGRLLSRRWGWVAAVEALAVALWIGVLGGLTWRYRGPLMLAPEQAPDLQPAMAAFDLIAPPIFLAMVLALLGAVAGAIVRFRRSGGVERQQMKWFVLALVFTALGASADFVFGMLAPPAAPLANVLYVLEVLAFGSGPVAIGVAILRYRLFDIDVIINRALVYTALTTALALVYFGSVVLLQRLFRTLSGQGSDLAVVGSTLAIAALFSPLRRRVQHFIDRQFYRRKYDAAQTLASYSAKIRDEVDLDRLNQALLEVVSVSMQPAHLSLWLREKTEPDRADS